MADATYENLMWAVLTDADTDRLEDTTSNTGSIDSVRLDRATIARETRALEERILQNISARSGSAPVSVQDRIDALLPLVLRRYRVFHVVAFAENERSGADARLRELQENLLLDTAGTMSTRTAVAILRAGEVGDDVPAGVVHQIEHEGYPRINYTLNEDIYEIVGLAEAIGALDHIIARWNIAENRITEQLERRAYRKQDSLFAVGNPEHFRTGVYGTDESFVVLVEGAPGGALHVMKPGFPPRTRTPAGLALLGYHQKTFDFDRPSRYILPVSGDDTFIPGLSKIKTGYAPLQSPNNLRESFPPEIMLAAFPKDKKYAAFIHWMDHVASPEIRARHAPVRNWDPPGGLQLFNKWYIHKHKSESLQNAAMLAAPSHRAYRALQSAPGVAAGAAALAPGQVALAKWNTVREHALFAHVE